MTVHVFISIGRFKSDGDLKAFVSPRYSEDGALLPSTFMTEVGMVDYEPMCIESMHQEGAVHMQELLRQSSYADQWLGELPHDVLADCAVCVFAPNLVRHPERTSLRYVGAFEYRSS